MRETLNSSEEKKLNLFEKIQNLREVLDICKSCSEISDLLMMYDESWRKENSIDWKLRRLGNKYQQLFDSYAKKDIDNEEDFNERYENIQKFLIELSNIFDEKVNPAKRWNNQMVDWFFKKVFKLNDSFYELNREINDQRGVARDTSRWSFEDYDYNIRLGTAEIYRNMVKNLDFIKEDNKYLWIFVYYSLLKLMDEEFKKLLGTLDEKKIPTEEEFKEVYDSLFISDFIKISDVKKMNVHKITTYKDFCDNYDILKNKQRELCEMKQEVDKMFDKNWNLISNAELNGLHMKKLNSFLKVTLWDITQQKVAKVLGKKRKN